MKYFFLPLIFVLCASCDRARDVARSVQEGIVTSAPEALEAAKPALLNGDYAVGATAGGAVVAMAVLAEYLRRRRKARKLDV